MDKLQQLPDEKKNSFLAALDSVNVIFVSTTELLLFCWQQQELFTEQMKSLRLRRTKSQLNNEKVFKVIYQVCSVWMSRIQGVPELSVPKQTLITFLFFDLETWNWKKNIEDRLDFF